MTVDYYQGQVVEYLRSDRAIFVNTECCIQLREDANPKAREHWYCDAVACDFRTRTTLSLRNILQQAIIKHG